MKPNKFDFFSSPSPRNLILHNIQKMNEEHQSQQEQQDLFDFFTPQKIKPQVQNNAIVNIEPFLSCPIFKNKRKNSLELDAGDPQSNDFGVKIQEQMNLGFQKPDAFVKQEQAFDATPYKFIDPAVKQEYVAEATPYKFKDQGQNSDLNASTRKKLYGTFSSPATQSKNVERSLRNLASQAYKFTLTQKKTTYKQVAAKLIYQLSDQSDLDLNLTKRNSQMNVKRRVYDALNVLIAVGLLRRSGNKIVAKKPETPVVITDRQSQRKREQMLKEQLQRLKTDSKKLISSLQEKRKIHKNIASRVDKLRKLQHRNKSGMMNSLKQSCYQINLPFLVMCHKQQKSLNSQKYFKKPVMQIQEQGAFLICRCPQGLPKFLGDSDAINYLDINYSQPKCKVQQ